MLLKSIFACLFYFLVNCFYAQFNYKLKKLTVPFSKSGKVLPNAASGGLNYCNISRLDVNADGKKDLIMYDKTDNKVHVYLNNNTQTAIQYNYSPLYTDKFPILKFFCLLADYDNDGKEDVFTSSGDGIIVYKNTSTNANLAFTLVTKKFGTIYTNYFPSVPANKESQLYNGADAIPGLYDLDGDGDLDIFAFAINGFTVDVNKNLSQETYGNSDSLIFKRIDDCFGNFRETNCQSFSLYPASANSASTIAKCDLSIFQAIPNQTSYNSERVQHAGASLLIFDPDKDGDPDLLLGDISCDSVKYFKNVPISGANVMGSSTIEFPNENDPIEIFQYPASYYLDVDDDGKKDLLVSPNKTSAENRKSIYLYKNYANSSSAKDSFELYSKSFLQNESVDLGEDAYPVLYDLDKDGDLDLLIGAGSFIDETDNNLRKASIYYYRNSGSNAQPNYEYVTDDYLGSKSFGLKNIRPAFGDLDNDGDDDMVLGNFEGNFIAFKNIAAQNAAPNFILNTNRIPTQLYDIGNNSSPIIIDINKDGRNDIISGRASGKLSLLLALTDTSFSINNNWGNLNFAGITVPALLKYNGKQHLVVGTDKGALHLLDTLKMLNANETLQELNPNIYNFSNIKNASPFFGDITGDGKPDLILGNARGGIYIFEGDTAKPFSGVVGIQNTDQSNFKLTIYPNPAQKALYISNVRSEVKIVCYDIIGRIQPIETEWDEVNKLVTINVSKLNKGLYSFKCTMHGKNILNQRIIKE